MSAYPEGKAWRCPSCEFTCADDGPDFCPHDGGVLTRVLMSFPRVYEDRETPAATRKEKRNA